MRLLFAIKRLTAAAGGAERVLCAVCTELVRRGHDVTLVTFDRPGGDAFYPLDARIRRIDLGIGESERTARVWESLRRILALRRVVTRTKPQVAVGFMHSMFVLLAAAVAGCRIPVVASEHIVPEHYRGRPLQYALFIVVAPLLSKVTVLSEAIRIHYPWLIRRRMVVMPNPVMPAIGAARPESDKLRRVLLNVGRLDPQKDHGTLIRAFAALAEHHPDWELRIFGEGPLRKELERQVGALGLQERIRMPGTTRDIGAEYRQADAFVISSRYEAFGLVTAEAMSYGLPAVGFADCPGTNELIEDGVTGLLADGMPDRPTSLARQLESLMSNSALRRKLGDMGKAFVERRFSLALVGDRWEALLKQLGREH